MAQLTSQPTKINRRELMMTTFLATAEFKSILMNSFLDNRKHQDWQSWLLICLTFLNSGPPILDLEHQKRNQHARQSQNVTR